MKSMSIDTSITAEAMAELQLAADLAQKGIRDPKVFKDACERMDRMREELLRKYGVLDIGVKAIRELRDA